MNNQNCENGTKKYFPIQNMRIILDMKADQICQRISNRPSTNMQCQWLISRYHAIPHAGFGATSRAEQALHMACASCCQHDFNLWKLGVFCHRFVTMNFIIHSLLHSSSGFPFLSRWSTKWLDEQAEKTVIQQVAQLSRICAR